MTFHPKMLCFQHFCWSTPPKLHSQHGEVNKRRWRWSFALLAISCWWNYRMSLRREKLFRQRSLVWRSLTRDMTWEKCGRLNVKKYRRTVVKPRKSEVCGKIWLLSTQRYMEMKDCGTITGWSMRGWSVWSGRPANWTLGQLPWWYHVPPGRVKDGDAVATAAGGSPAWRCSKCGADGTAGTELLGRNQRMGVLPSAKLI